jgi:hypothetical protein
MAPRGERPQGRTRGAATATELVVHEEHVLALAAPPGSRFKGHEGVVVRELRLAPRVIRYRRQRWLTPDGRTLVAPLPAGVLARSGPELRRFVLLQHHQGQVTAERITACLNGLGLVISKRQVVRLLTTESATLAAEAEGRCCGPAWRRRAGSRSTIPAPAIGPPTG